MREIDILVRKQESCDFGDALSVLWHHCSALELIFFKALYMGTGTPLLVFLLKILPLLSWSHIIVPNLMMDTTFMFLLLDCHYSTGGL